MVNSLVNSGCVRVAVIESVSYFAPLHKDACVGWRRNSTKEVLTTLAVKMEVPCAAAPSS